MRTSRPRARAGKRTPRVVAAMAEETPSSSAPEAPAVADGAAEAAAASKGSAAVKTERVKPLPRPDRAAYDETIAKLQTQVAKHQVRACARAAGSAAKRVPTSGGGGAAAQRRLARLATPRRAAGAHRANQDDDR